MRPIPVLLLVLACAHGLVLSPRAPYVAARSIRSARSMDGPRCGEGKGAIGGAVLGGLLAGPFGALWGAQIGGAMGANSRARREEEERWRRRGVTREMLQAAEACASELAEAEESLGIVLAAEQSQRELIVRLEAATEEAYGAAESALRAGDEAGARERLEERQRLRTSVDAARAEMAAASQRVSSMKASVSMIAQRAAAVEGKIAAAVGESGGAPSSPASAPEPEDPLIARFKELEGQ